MGERPGGSESGGAGARTAVVGRRSVLLGLGAAGVVGAVGSRRGIAALAGPRVGGPVARVAAPPAAVTFTVDRSAVEGRIPPGLVGLSVERRTLTQRWLDPGNAPLIALLRLLGPGVLRIGGNTVEKVGWDPAGAGLDGAHVAPPDIDRLAAFLDAVGWTVIYGTPFLTGTPASVAEEVTVAAATLGPRLVAVELANEPDLYVLQPGGGAVATFPTWHAAWRTFADAILARTPGVPLAGPGTCFLSSIPSYGAGFAEAEHPIAPLLTQHYYRGFGTGAQDIALLLGPDPALDEALGRLAALSASTGMAWRLGETNSFANGGQPGVSNTFASALWAVGLADRASRHGTAGLQFHNSGAADGYEAIAQLDGVVTAIHPLFYGLLLAASLPAGPIHPVSTVGDAAALRCTVVGRSATELTVIVANRGAAPVDVAVAFDRPVAAATARWLAGPALDATEGTTFGGAAVGIDGSWAPAPPQPVVLGPAGALPVSFTGSGAVLLHVQLAPDGGPPSTTTTPTTTTSTTPPASSAVGPVAPAATEPVPAPTPSVASDPAPSVPATAGPPAPPPSVGPGAAVSATSATQAPPAEPIVGPAHFTG